jgi:hypothetical protein
VGKLLQGQLPISLDPQVSGDTYNRAIRSLELSLNTFNTEATPSFLAADRDLYKFQKGDVIWNITEEVLQVWLGDSWENISTPETSGLSATATLGTIQVIASGDITVEVS